jgi:hypothetical protein
MRMYGWWMRPPVVRYKLYIPRLHWSDIQVVPLIIGIIFGLLVGFFQ